MSNIGRFAYKSIRLHRIRFAYTKLTSFWVDNSKEFLLSNKFSWANLNTHKRILNWFPHSFFRVTLGGLTERRSTRSLWRQRRPCWLLFTQVITIKWIRIRIRKGTNYSLTKRVFSCFEHIITKTIENIFLLLSRRRAIFSIVVIINPVQEGIGYK